MHNYNAEYTLCTFLFPLSSSIVTAWWSLCSVSVQKWHTHICSSRQNISNNLSCFLHILSCRSFTGAISLWSFKVATLWWGCRWVSQYEVKQTRQDFRAFTCEDVTAQTSHTTSPGLAADSGEVDEQSILINASASSLKAVLILISGRVLNDLLQVGHRQAPLLPHIFWRQTWQKLCPQGVVTGSRNTCPQMVQWNCFCGNMLLEEAITCRTVKKLKGSDQLLRKTFERGSACKDLYPYSTNMKAQRDVERALNFHYVLNFMWY